VSFKVEVMVIGESKWAGNALRFATGPEAEEAAKELAARWIMVQEWRVAESDDPVNYKWENGGAVSVATAEG
jgi:hypothetical protein